MPKRVNFSSIQASHIVACKGYRQGVVRTGYEQVVAQRTSDLFAKAADKSGIVKAISDIGIVIEYSDGETKGYELGRRFGKAAGLDIPHSLVTDLKLNQKINEGDIICYNEGFFEKDILNPKNVILKNGLVVKTALLESTDTFEDSSSICREVANLLSTKITKVKDIIVSFDQSIHNLVKIGNVVASEDILCTIEDSVTSESKLFNKESLDTLRILSAATPQAKVKGMVERIEIYYHGDKEDMSESLCNLVTLTDRELAKRNKSIGKKALTGKVDDSFRIEGEALALDTLDIRVYITTDISTNCGDKTVFANQMKSVIGTVFEEPMLSESGTKVQAIFGYRSINARIVNSPILMGTTATLLQVVSKQAAKLYFGN